LAAIAGFSILAITPVVHGEFSDESIDYALNENLLDYSTRPALYGRQSRTLLILALAARDFPDHPRYEEVKDRLIEHVRHVLAGEPVGGGPSPEPQARGGGAREGWRIPGLAHTLAIVKRTPALWDALGNDTEERYQERCDWLMKAIAAGGCWSMDDDNDFLVDIAGKGYHKFHGPNHHEGYVGAMMAAAVYFEAENGHPERLNQIFMDFDYDTWVDRFRTYGWENMLSIWAPQDDPDRRALLKMLMNDGGKWPDEGEGKGIRGNSYSHFGVPVDDVFGQYAVLANRMFFYNVTDSISGPFDKTTVILPPGGTRRLLSDKQNPRHGKRGMLFEFYQGDAKGLRSSLPYSKTGWSLNILHQAMLKSFDLLPNDDRTADIERRCYVGTMDLLFKGKEGWKESSQTWSGDQYYELEGAQKSLWKDYLESDTPPDMVGPVDEIKLAPPDADIVNAPMKRENGALKLDTPFVRFEPYYFPKNTVRGLAQFVVTARHSRPYAVWVKVARQALSGSLFLSRQCYGGQNLAAAGSRRVRCPLVPSSEAVWQKFAEPIYLRAGFDTLLLEGRSGGVEIEELYLTDRLQKFPPGQYLRNTVVPIVSAIADTNNDVVHKTFDKELDCTKQFYTNTRNEQTREYEGWVEWQLDESAQICGVGIASTTSGRRRFELELSDGESWTTVIDTGVIDTFHYTMFQDYYFNPVNAERVRFTAKDKWLRICEIEVYALGEKEVATVNRNRNRNRTLRNSASASAVGLRALRSGNNQAYTINGRRISKRKLTTGKTGGVIILKRAGRVSRTLIVPR